MILYTRKILLLNKYMKTWVPKTIFPSIIWYDFSQDKHLLSSTQLLWFDFSFLLMILRLDFNLVFIYKPFSSSFNLSPLFHSKKQRILKNLRHVLSRYCIHSYFLFCWRSKRIFMESLWQGESHITRLAIKWFLNLMCVNQF